MVKTHRIPCGSHQKSWQLAVFHVHPLFWGFDQHPHDIWYVAMNIYRGQYVQIFGSLGFDQYPSVGFNPGARGHFEGGFWLNHRLGPPIYGNSLGEAIQTQLAKE